MLGRLELAPDQVRVLVASHDGLTREILERTLTPRGYDCVFVDSAVEAADVLGRQEFDLLLLDVFMPDTPAMESLRVVADHPRMAVVVLTAFASALVTEAIKLRADELIAGPANLDELVQRIERAIKRRALLTSDIDDHQ